MTTDQVTPMGSAYDHWGNVVGGAENVEPDAPPLAMDSKQLPKKRARRRGFRVRGGDDKPQGTDHRRHIHGMHYFSFARFASRHNDAERVESISSAAHLQNERGGTMEAPLLSALFLLTSLLFLVSLLSLYYSIAFSHLRRWLRLTEEYDDCRTKFCCVFSARVKSVRNESTNLCEDIYTPLCSTVNITCPDVEIRSRHHTWSVSYVLTKRLMGLAEVLRSPEALKNPASNASAFLFRSCLARGQRLSVHNDVRRLLTSVGLSSWPVLENQSTDVVLVLTALLRNFAAPYVVTLSVGESVINSEALSVSLEAPELLLGPTSWQLTLATETVQDVHKHRWAYERYALAILYDVLPGVASGDALSKLATDLYVFEQALSAHIPRRSTYADRVEVRLHHLQESHDLALWSGILRDVFDNLEHSTLQLVPVVLFSRYYLAFLNDLLWKRSVVLVNYLGWRMVEYIAWSCSANLRDHRRRFRDAVRPFKLATDSLEVQCAMEVYQLLPASSSRLYRFAVSLLPKNERILLHLTVSSLKVALTAILQGSPWVDNATQSHAIRKVRCGRM
ncbi:hypothetical protein MRX96_023617 [Rhipicephalus microplus]